MKKLIEKRAVLKALLESMLATAKTEERAFTEEEDKKFSDTEAEIRALDKTIEAEERAKGIKSNVIPAVDYKPEERAEDVEKAEERAFSDFIKGKVVEMRTGEQNIDTTNNGAIIPTTIANRIIDTVKEICPILAGADIYRVKGNLKIPKWTKANTTHDITVGYASEFTELVADSGKFISVDLGGYLAGALTLIGRSIENNSAFDLTAFVIRKMAEKISEFIEGELLKGTGSNAAEGALRTTNAVTAADDVTVSLDDLIKVQAAVKSVYQRNACWTMNTNTFTALKLMKDGVGHPLLQEDVTQDFPYRLLGKPVYISDNMPDIAKSSTPILYGDYTGLSVNIRENISIEVLREKYATQHALGVVAWFEFDSKVSDEQKLAKLVMAAS